MKLPEFPPKHVSMFKLGKDDIYTRKVRLEKFLQQVVEIRTLLNSFEIQFFLEARKHVSIINSYYE